MTELTKRCEKCIHCKSVSAKLVNGLKGSTVVKYYVDCKVRGIRLAYSMGSSNQCSNYELDNDKWELDMESYTWKKVNAFGE